MTRKRTESPYDSLVSQTVYFERALRIWEELWIGKMYNRYYLTEDSLRKEIPSECYYVYSFFLKLPFDVFFLLYGYMWVIWSRFQSVLLQPFFIAFPLPCNCFLIRIEFLLGSMKYFLSYMLLFLTFPVSSRAPIFSVVGCFGGQKAHSFCWKENKKNL